MLFTYFTINNFSCPKYISMFTHIHAHILAVNFVLTVLCIQKVSINQKKILLKSISCWKIWKTANWKHDCININLKKMLTRFEQLRYVWFFKIGIFLNE